MSEHEQKGSAHSATARAVNSQHTLTDVGVWELDLRSNRLTWSEAVYRIFQIDPAQFGATYDAFLERVHPEDRQRVDNAYLEHLTNRKPYTVAHRLLLPGNRVRTNTAIPSLTPMGNRCARWAPSSTLQIINSSHSKSCNCKNCLP